MNISREIQIYTIPFLTDGRADISNYREALLLQNVKQFLLKEDILFFFEGVTSMSDLLSSAQQAVGSSSGSTAKLLPTAISCAPGQSSSNSLSVLGAAGIGSGGSLPGYSGAHTQVKVSSVHGEGGTHHQIAAAAAGGSLSSKSVGGVSNSGMSGAMSGVIYSTVNSDIAGGGGHNRAMSTPELAVCGPTYQRPPGIQSLAVPPGGGIPPVRPPHSMPARRGNNVTASKRTRFALQVN